MGKVSEGSVRLQRVIPMLGNSFKPFFLGRFQRSGEKVQLVGRFTMLPITKVFMTIWFAMVALASVGLLFGLTSTVPAPAILAPFAMIGGGVAMVAFGKWLARNDTAWLSEVIEGALRSPEASAAARGATTPADPAAVPATLKLAAMFLAASGVMAAFWGLMMPQLSPIPTLNGAVPPFPSLGRWPLVYPGVAVVLALGVWRRRPWAWWGFFVLLGLSACWPVYAMRVTADFRAPLAMKVTFTAMCGVITLLWGRWWYGQRRYFIWS